MSILPSDRNLGNTAKRSVESFAKGLPCTNSRLGGTSHFFYWRIHNFIMGARVTQTMGFHLPDLLQDK